MKTTKLCRECGQPVPSDAVLGLCPQCMMKAGLPKPAKATIAVSPDAFVEGPETETKSFIPGTKLGYIGDYELLEEIARGGMGVVYKARQSSLKRIVAVKTIRSGQLANEVEVRRFHTEAEAAAQLQHPNIVAIHEIGEHQGQHYFSMDFVEGKNLAQVANGKPVAARSAAEWLKAIAGAVQFAHQRGVLHRDLKPQNIMLDAAGRPRVMDFGLAKTLGSDSSVTHTGAVMGSPSYMSPEQALGRNGLVGPASDVYALGAILYELLTGRPPFRGKTMLDTMSQVVNDEAPPPRSLNSDAPVDLESICLKCLEKVPARRYPTARELEADLGRFLDGEPVQARPADALRRTMSWFRRHRWVFSAAVSVLMITLAGLAYGFWEQISFMAWLNAHPGQVKPPGHPGAELDWLSRQMIGWMLVAAAIGAGIGLWLRTNHFWDKLFSAKGGPRASALVVVFAASHLLCIALALFLAKQSIHAFVWEGSLPSGFVIVLIYYLAYGSVHSLLQFARLQMRIPIEPRPEVQPAPLPPEQLPPIHEAIYAGRTMDALDLYRAAAGGTAKERTADKADLGKMETELKPAHPEKFSAGVLNQPSMVVSFFQGRRGFFQGRRGWILWGIILLLSSLWMLALPEPFSKSNPSLLQLGFGLLVGASIRFAAFLLGCRFGTGQPGADSFGVVGWKKVYHSMWRWIRFLARMASLVLAVAILAFDFVFLLAVFVDSNAHTGFAFHNGQGFFFCWLVVGLLLIHLLLKKRISIEPRPEDKPVTQPVPRSELLNRQKLLKMEVELLQAHPEKFSAETINRRKIDRAFGYWLVMGIALVAGLFMLTGQSLWLLYWLLGGFGFGALVRGMSSNKMAGWKSAYREMRPVIKFLALVLVPFFALGFAALVVILFGLIVHPHPHTPQENLFVCFTCGLVPGWLLVHLWQKKRKAP